MIYLKELYLKMKKHYRSDNVLFCYKIVGTKKYIKNNTTTSTADAIITIANENQSNAEAIKSIIDRFN